VKGNNSFILKFFRISFVDAKNCKINLHSKKSRVDSTRLRVDRINTHLRHTNPTALRVESTRDFLLCTYQTIRDEGYRGPKEKRTEMLQKSHIVRDDCNSSRHSNYGYGHKHKHFQELIHKCDFNMYECDFDRQSVIC
jgi:hypothetical protein